MACLKRKVVLILVGALVFLPLMTVNSAESFMTVGQLQEMIDQGPASKVVATAYVQGTIDGLLGMDSLLKKEQDKKPEFCKFFEISKKRSIAHPASKTEFIVRKWQEGGHSMDTLAVDMLIMYMTAQYGCAN